MKEKIIPLPVSRFSTSEYERAVIERLDLILAELREQTEIQHRTSELLKRATLDGNSILTAPK